jgi:hypothetical protein
MNQQSPDFGFLFGAAATLAGSVTGLWGNL